MVEIQASVARLFATALLVEAPLYARCGFDDNLTAVDLPSLVRTHPRLRGLTTSVVSELLHGLRDLEQAGRLLHDASTVVPGWTQLRLRADVAGARRCRTD